MIQSRLLAAALSGALLAGGVAPVLAQETTRDTVRVGTAVPGTVPNQGANTNLGNANQGANPNGMGWFPAAQPLDAPIRRAEYALGPGDVVDVSLFGDVNVTHSLVVTPEGTVVIPSIGVVRVLGLNLDQAQARARAAVLRLYRSVEVSLSLAHVRSFKVYLLGDVANPGMRLASSVTRLSEVLPAPRGSRTLHRNILVRRAEGDSMRVDMAPFYITGDLRGNPTLRAGDVLVIPVVDETVEAYGRVFYPGSFQFREGESLAEFLDLVNGGAGFPSNAADSVRIARWVTPQQREFTTLSRADALGARGRALILRPTDAIFVAEMANYGRQRRAVVTGQVRYPGTYPVRPDTTTVRELVAMAGGFTAQASLTSATLRRGVAGAEIQGLGGVPTDLRGAPLDSTARFEEREIQRIRAQGDETNVVVDFQQLFASGQDAYDQTVRGGDVLNVPERRNDVAVLGAVRTPGLVQFTPGQRPEHYIRLAGWYTRRADFRDAVVLRAKLGTPLQAEEVRSLEAGDVIVVPFRQRRTVIERLASVQAVASIVSGLIVTVVAITQLGG
ncbi:MAG TPA: SLBB domain-containing protein [Longimicrobium sp.]|jgi:protein involved in polysaccharide export with SLBB domain